MREYNEGEIVNKLIETLKKQGVSENSIVIDWPIDNRHRVDLAIIDKVLNKPIALFEVMRRRDSRTVSQAESQIKEYASILNEQNIPYFIIFPGLSDDNLVDIHQIKPKWEGIVEPRKKEKSDRERAEEELAISEKRYRELVEEASSQIPDINILTNSARQKTLFDLLKKKENAIENFQLVCWIMGFCSLIILLLNFANILALTPERIALFGVVFGLFLLPYASKIKIFGFEFERVKNAEK